MYQRCGPWVEEELEVRALTAEVLDEESVFSYSYL